MKRLLLCISILLCVVSCRKSDDTPTPTGYYADLAVIGKIFTSESDATVEAFAVKDGKYIYVGDKAGVAGYIKEGVTTVVNHEGKGDALQIQKAKPLATYFEGKKVYPAAN